MRRGGFCFNIFYLPLEGVPLTVASGGRDDVLSKKKDIFLICLLKWSGFIFFLLLSH